MSNENNTKFIATQNIIKNKYCKAYANRLEHENELKHTIQPIHMVSTNDASTTHSRPMSTTKEIVVDINAENSNPNKLCEKMRLLLSPMNACDLAHVEEINSIIVKLREQEIIV